jgi:molybdate transport system permease protein
VTEAWPILALSLGVAATSTLAIVIPGIAVARVLAGRWRGRALLETLVSLPLVLPPTTVGLVLLLLFGRRGPLGRVLHEWFGIDVVLTLLGAVLAAAVVSFPLLVRQVRAALEEVDPRLLSLSRSLGIPPLRGFFEVHLPLAWRGTLAGIVLAFARALGEFGATILVAGNIPGRTQTLALAIFQRIQVGRDRDALWLAGLSALVAFACLWAVERLSARRERRLGDEGTGGVGGSR